MNRQLISKVLDAAVHVAAKMYDVGEREILSACRIRRIAHARHYAMWLLRELGYSLPEIGRRFDRDHTSVIHAVRAHERRVESGEFLPTIHQNGVDNCHSEVEAKWSGVPKQGKLAA